ncbi:hypothetical protein BCN13_28730, partial [Salmonella enterica]|nr:hypothetical protein [Salmonella enterica]HAC8273806.1 hypothetical protein [Salmonella enterica]
GAQYWPDKHHARNYAVANQHLSGSNDLWKKKVGYHRRSLAGTAMFQIRTLLGVCLSLQVLTVRNAEVGYVLKKHHANQ